MTSQGTQVGPGTMVSLSYELYDADGELVEVSNPIAPLSFIWGYGQASPALEAALSGCVAGQARRVRLTAAEAFGPRDPERIIEVDLDELPSGVRVGDELDADLDSGGPVTLKVLEIDGERAILDANHPLAGQTVELDAVIEDVRPATASELSVAEAALQGEAARGSETLLPAERLLKRTVGPSGGK